MRLRHHAISRIAIGLVCTLAAPAIGAAPPSPPELVPGGRLGPPGVPQLVRWVEDWSAPPAKDASILERIRHIPLGGENTYLSIGGEARYYYQNSAHTALGTRADDGDFLVLERIRLIGDLHVGPDFRLYTELGEDREYGEEFPTPSNRDGVDVRQAFIDGRVRLDQVGSLTLRLGRFELPLGSGKLVSLRDGRNVRFYYNGARATYTLPGVLRIDGFDAKPLSVLPGPFDDESQAGQSFKGIHTTVSLEALKLPLSFDAYVYRMDRDAVRMAGVVGDDRRNTYGVRLYGKTSGLDYDLEFARQSGRFADSSIRAWAGLIEGGYTFQNIPLTPRVFVRANAFSGDDSASDRTLGTFIPPAPKATLLTGSDASWFNLSNLVDLFPSVTLRPNSKTVLNLGVEFFWRQTVNDGLYGIVGNLLPFQQSNSRFIGTAYNVEGVWNLNKYLTFRAFWTYLAMSDGLRAAGGKNANFIAFMAVLRF